MRTRLGRFVSLFALSLLLMSTQASTAAAWDNAYFTADTSVAGQVTLTFTTTNPWASCFEYRADGDHLSWQIDTIHPYNPDIYDGLYEYKCVGDGYGTRVAQVVVPANDFVEVRLVFGAESDEWFQWTTVDVPPAPVQPTSLQDCMNGGFENYGFSNQGQCNRYVNTGQDSRP